VLEERANVCSQTRGTVGSPSGFSAMGSLAPGPARGGPGCWLGWETGGPGGGEPGNVAWETFLGG